MYSRVGRLPFNVCVLAAVVDPDFSLGATVEHIRPAAKLPRRVETSTGAFLRGEFVSPLAIIFCRCKSSEAVENQSVTFQKALRYLSENASLFSLPI